MEKVGHLRVRQFYGVPFASKHGKSGALEGSTILRRTIYEGNMENVGNLNVLQFYGVPFAWERYKKWAT